MPVIPIPDGVRRAVQDDFDEREADRYREEADAKLKQLQNTPMAKLGKDAPLNISTERPKWMGSRGYDTPDFTSTAEPTIVPDESDPARDYGDLGPAPSFAEELSRPAEPEDGSREISFGTGGPEGPPLDESLVIDIRKRLADKGAATADKDMRSRLLQGVNPDQAASAIELAEKSGVNRVQVEANPETYKRADTMRQINDLRTSAPKLRAWLDYNPENLDVAHDDVDNLGWWEQAQKTLGEVGGGIGGALASGYLKISEGTYGVARAGFELNDQLVSTVTGKPQISEPSKFFAGLQEEAKSQSDSFMPEVDDPTARGVLSGFQSLPPSVMAAVMGIMSGGAAPALGAMGGITGGSEYGRARSQGMSPTAAAGYGTGQGLIEAGTEALPMGWLLGDVAKRTPFFEMLAKQALGEGVTEQVATHSQDFLSWAVLPENADKPIATYLEERGPAAYETLIATLVGTGVQTTVAKSVDMTLQAASEGAQARRADQLAKTFEAMSAGAAASKLLKRLPEKYRQVVADVTKDGPLESVRVQPEAFEELAQSAGVSTEQLAQAFRIDPADINSALTSGEDVVIPSGNYAAALQTAKKEIGVSGETIHAAFAPNMRLRAEDFTAKEREAMKAVYEEERAATEQANSDTTFADAADRVREAVRTQLADAKVFNNETASTQAQIASEMIITLAERTGQDPEALWNEVGFKVAAQVGEDVNELSQSQTRPAEPVSDEELTRASEALQPREFEAWKLGREGRSAEDIAVAIGGENADVSPQTVLAWQTAARRKGFALARLHEPTNPKGRPQTPETQRVIEMLAAGKSRDEIITEVYPDRDAGKARNLVRQLAHKHKDAIEAKRAPVMELAQDKRGGFTGINLSQDPVIRLYASANLSTFSHEAAHWYLTTLEKLARAEAPHPFVISQLAAIREWAGKSAEFQIYDDTGQITPEGVELQEAFSETFEAYLREGKAPSTALRQVFATMKAWLLRVYKSIRNIGSRVNLNEEIKDVFDRMLATEEAIAAARTGMEQDADRMAKALLDKGVITEKAYARTRERLQAAREKAEADLMARLMEEYERSQKSWYRDEERQVRRDVTSEIDERPEQRAFAWLSGKGWRDTQADHVERAAEAEFMQAVDEGLFETDANDDTLKLLQQRAIERGLGPLILMFRTTSGRIIAFPGENGAVYHDLARNLFGLGDLKLEHGMYNPRKWPTLADMDAAGDRAWYATTGEHADTEARELAQRTYQHDKHREQVKTAYDYLRDNPEAISSPLSKIMVAVDVSAYAADRARRLIRKGELAQLDGAVIVYRGSEENGISSAGVGRLGTGVYLAEDPEIGGEWGGQTGKVDAYRINGRLFDLDETTAEGLENYEKQEDTEAAKKLFARLRSEGYVGVRDPWSGHINVFVDGAMERYADADVELGATWTNEEPELGQMGGERSFLFPHDQKQRAFDMEQSGVSEAEIWRETGLARGADGAWRHEIDDSKAVLLPKLDEIDALGDEAVPLDQVLRHKMLFEAYPQLKKITVSFQPSDSKDGGYWQVFGRHIAISRASKSQMLSVLLHELQHAIQDIERFASGGSFNQPRMENPEWTAFQKQVQEDAELRAFLEQRRRLSRRIAAAERIAKSVQDQAIQLAIQKIDEVDLSEVEKIDERIYALYAPVKAVLQSKYPDVQDLWRDEAKLRDSGKLPPVVPDRYISGMDVYYALAGEVEARNVQSRAKMTVEERAEKAPSETEWPKRARQIVQFKGFGFSLSQTGGNARTTPPLALPPMRLDLAAVKEQYGDEALAAIPPEVRAYSAQATDADQFAEVARDVRKTLAKKRPKSLWKFLSTSRVIGSGNDKISYRGIRDDGGELLKIIGEKKAAPGLIADSEDAKKVRSYTIEHAAEAAWAEGYFNGPNPPTPAEFLDALRADFDGQAKLYARADMADIQEIADAEAWSAWFDQNGIDINEKDPAVLKTQLEEALSSGAENAIGPDEAAAMLGGVLKTKALPDGNALLQALKAGPQRDKLIREETKRRMIEKHGDIFRNGTIAEEAKTYARNEIQLRQTEIELEALAKAAGQFAANNLAKQQAIENLRTKQVREVLNYNQWLVLEQRWGKKALEAAEKGKFDEAARYKKFQLLNMMMFREGRKLAEDIEKTRKTLIAYGTKPRQQRLYAAGKAYADNMNSLLDDYQLRNETKSGENKRQERAAWIKAQLASIDPFAAYQDTTKTAQEQQVEAAEAIEKSRALADLDKGGDAQNYKSLSVSDFMALGDEAALIWKMATLADQLLKEGKRRRLTLAAEDIAAEIITNQPKEKPPEPIESDAPGEKLKRGALKYFAMHRTMQSLAHQFAGGKDGGVFWSYFVKPLNAAFAQLSTLRKQMGDDLTKLFGAYSKQEIARFYKDRQTFNLSSGKVSLTTQGRLAVALNVGNEKNRQRLMDSMGWTLADIQTITDTLEKRDWDFIQATWDYLNTWFPEANRVHEAVHGAPMEKVEPMQVATKFGVYAGGYYPIAFDPELSSKSAQRKTEADAKSISGRVDARSAPGFSKKRVEGKVTLPLKLSVFDVITRHLDQVATSIATEEALFDAGRLIRRPEVEQAIVQHHGRQIYNTIVNTLVTTKFGMEGTSGILAHLRNGATVVGLGWKVSTALLQPLGVSNSIVRVGGYWIAKGYARMGKDAATIQSSAKWIMDRSEFMRHRRQSQSPELAALKDSIKKGGITPRWLTQSMFALMSNMQFYSVDCPTWYGGWYKAKAAGANDLDAAAQADQAVIDAQGGGELHQTAAIQTGAGTKYAAALRLLTNFMSYMVTTYNLSTQRARNANSLPKIAALVFDLVLMLSVPVAGKMMLDAWTKGGDDDDDDQLWEKFGREQVAFLMSPFVGLSQIAGSARGEDAFGYRGPAGFGIFAEGTNAGKAAAEGKFITEDGELDPAFWRPANKAAGMLLHYPASQLDLTIRGATALWKGETDNPAAIFFGPPPAN